jgi:GTP pyrophosphokinase
MGRLLGAVRLARALHAGQVRKGTAIPYIVHPMGVARMVLGAGGSEAEVMAAVLHDVVEDCGGAPVLAKVEAMFGAEVAAIVAGCSKGSAGKEAYVASLAVASSSVRMVAGADKVYNARSLVSDVKREGVGYLARFKGGSARVLAYYKALVPALAGSPFGASLKEAVGELVALSE